MKHLLERYLLPFCNADGGGGGAGGGAAAAGAGNAAGGAGGAAAVDDKGGSEAAAAAAAAAAAGATGPYRPQGLPDTMFGKDDRETMDKMATALNGYRQRDSAVPDKVEAYNAFEVDKAPEAIRPHLQELAKDPLFGAVAKVAMEEKVPPGVLHKLTTALYSQAAEAGILEAAIDPAKERAALLPESAKNLPKAEQDKAINARMQENEDFIKLLTKPGADGKSRLDPKVGENALLMLMDTAQGNEFLEFVRGQMTGDGKAQPFGGTGAAGGGTGEREALRAELAKPEMNPQHPKFDRAAYDGLNERYRKLFPA